ncbi:hypothetical protein HELRODRAFT_189810 [Helobdella robusta]|uniref:RRM domain-containing protein n=1 Tax=Helobdella robusta TaxID=6412 RepID=T1FRD9_HELRO|nr:hypothetical protein HELRODRAFT_189810 [Helobdella robusta]ESN91782.1 hypothetical protein HELRODRAFT_189810 [Helobdella robusta]
MSASYDDCIVRLRGLPWSVSNEEIINFFEGCSLADINLLYNKDGRPSGEAFVELSTTEDMDIALSKHREYMGRRYIDVFSATRNEMEWTLRKNGMPRFEENQDAVVKLRGLPYSCDKDTLVNFFEGLPITPNGISLMTDPHGNATGDAYVQFANQKFADVALKKHKERIGHRYIEIFRSTLSEARSAIAAAHKSQQQATSRRPAPYDRPTSVAYQRNKKDRLRGPARQNDGDDDDDDFYSRSRFKGNRVSNYISQTGYSIHMRGLPFSATESDVMEFFYPTTPVNIEIELNQDGRPSGNANADFMNKYDADQAMKKDRQSIKHRYIELFYTGKMNRGEGDDVASNWKSF